MVLEQPVPGLSPQALSAELPESRNNLTGIYYLDKKHWVEVTMENGKLFIESRTNQLPRTRLFSIKNGGFVVASVLLNIHIEFEANRSGKIYLMKSRQDGQEKKWKKKQV